MRYTPLTGAKRNIRRVDYVKRNGKSKTALWQVHFTFKDRKKVSQSFSDSLFGGKESKLLFGPSFFVAQWKMNLPLPTLFLGTQEKQDQKRKSVSVVRVLNEKQLTGFASIITGKPHGLMSAASKSTGNFSTRNLAGNWLQSKKRFKLDKKEFNVFRQFAKARQTAMRALRIRFTAVMPGVRLTRFSCRQLI